MPVCIDWSFLFVLLGFALSFYRFLLFFRFNFLLNFNFNWLDFNFWFGFNLFLIRFFFLLFSLRVIFLFLFTTLFLFFLFWLFHRINKGFICRLHSSAFLFFVSRWFISWLSNYWSFFSIFILLFRLFRLSFLFLFRFKLRICSNILFKFRVVLLKTLFLLE